MNPTATTMHPCTLPLASHTANQHTQRALTRARTCALGLLVACAAPWALAAGSSSDGHAHHHPSSAAPSIGSPGVASKVTRTIAVTMSDAMRFTPASINVRQGETIRFQVTNAGQVRHEFNLGTLAELQAHAQVMQQSPDMQHDEPNVVNLAPGTRGEVIWHFSHSGTVDFACLIPGHFEAGMQGKVNVATPPTSPRPKPHAH